MSFAHSFATAQMTSQPAVPPATAPGGAPLGPPQTVPAILAILPTVPAILPSGLVKCAIRECQEPCFVDQAGTVHECCGFTHAMEHQRRKAIEQRKKAWRVNKR